MTLLRQLVSFGAIGVVNTAVDIGTYSLLVSKGLPLGVAIFISTSLGLACSYALNGRFTFGGRQATARSLASFLAVSLVGLWLLQPAVIFGLRQGLALHGTAQLTAAKLAATVLTMVWNFGCYRRWVFV